MRGLRPSPALPLYGSHGLDPHPLQPRSTQNLDPETARWLVQGALETIWFARSRSTTRGWWLRTSSSFINT